MYIIKDIREQEIPTDFLYESLEFYYTKDGYTHIKFDTGITKVDVAVNIKTFKEFLHKYNEFIQENA